MTGDVEIGTIASHQTYPLRLAVLRPNGTINDCVFPDDDGVATIHFGAFGDAGLMGIASLYAEGHEQLGSMNGWRIRGMATDSNVRSRGFGRGLVEACINHADQHNASHIWCNARSTALGFYQKLGFRTMGEEFDILDIGPHHLMVLELVPNEKVDVC